MAEFNRRFQVPAAQRGTAFTACRRRDLDLIFSLQFERTVNRDNTVSFQNLALQIEPVRWRGTLAGCNVIVHQHLDGTLSMTLRARTAGPLHRPGYSDRRRDAAKKLWKSRSVEKSKNRLSHLAWKSRKQRGIPTFPQPRRRRSIENINRTFHVLRKPDIFTC